MIELTTSLLMLASAFSPAISNTREEATVNTVVNTVTEQAISPDYPLTSVSVEAYVRDYFANDPILAEIAKCESSFRQFHPNGEVVKGRVNKSDIGIMQINKYYHGEEAIKQGFDIYTIDGNLGYAKWLYGKYSDAPWVHSSKCWDRYQEIAMK